MRNGGGNLESREQSGAELDEEAQAMERQHQRRKKLFKCLVVGAILLIGGLIVFFLTRSDEDKPQDQDQVTIKSRILSRTHLSIKNHLCLIILSVIQGLIYPHFIIFNCVFFSTIFGTDKRYISVFRLWLLSRISVVRFSVKKSKHFGLFRIKK